MLSNWYQLIVVRNVAYKSNGNEVNKSQKQTNFSKMNKVLISLALLSVAAAAPQFLGGGFNNGFGGGFRPGVVGLRPVGGFGGLGGFGGFGGSGTGAGAGTASANLFGSNAAGVGISSATNGGFGSGSGSGLAGSGLFGNFATGTGNGQSFGK
uniref:Uncharacterized protein n=1 Tax=Daphnia galeata TaxID=27404 RepID=A0A8J2WIJ6_9CRUS|nr:unnamed protein product [Daphnia galeata]